VVREAVGQRQVQVTLTRRRFAAGIAAALTACRRSKNDEGPGATPGPSGVPATPAGRGARWLASRQGADGSWVSDVYGAFKEGFSLTPFATLALLESGLELDAARRGAAWLAAKTKDGHVTPGRITPSYPAYTAALAVRALSHPAAQAPLAAREAWLTELRGRQLTEALGWSKSDAHYGGWGYSTVIPRKPPAGTAVEDAFLESNLSSTAFALDGLAAAGVPASDPAFAAAREFVRRQQNYAEGDPLPVDDGGFFFVPADEVRNKAGRAEVASSLVRFHSYGTMTADGLRSLLHCGEPIDGPRASAALRWLRDRFDAAHHPGTYRPEREEVRDSAWFYWASSAAATLRLAGGDAAWWSAPLRAELTRRQREDGSWSNELVAVREDDPVVATSFALLALSASSRSG
jgi:hypothetical protein